MSVPKIIYLQHGGKTTIAKWILSYFPPHRTYVEPFFGSGAVLLRKPRSSVEVANDKDRSIINVYRQAIANPDALAAALRICPYHEGHDWDMGDDTLDAAVQAIAETKQKYSGSRNSATWRSAPHHKSHHKTWHSWWQRIAPAVARLRELTFHCGDACDVIRRYAKHEDALFYVDPPYLGHEREYRESCDYGQLVETLEGVNGYVVVSEYEGAEDNWPDGWGVDVREFVRRSKTGACTKKQEIVLLNPKALNWYENARLETPKKPQAHPTGTDLGEREV